MATETIRMTEQGFMKLKEYSCSIPTGVVIGKRWRRNVTAFMGGLKPHWVVGEYGPHEDPKKAAILWHDVEVG